MNNLENRLKKLEGMISPAVELKALPFIEIGLGGAALIGAERFSSLAEAKKAHPESTDILTLSNDSDSAKMGGILARWSLEFAGHENESPVSDYEKAEIADYLGIN